MTKVPDEWVELKLDSVEGQYRASISQIMELPNRTVCTEIYCGMVDSKEAAETIAARAADARGYKTFRMDDRTLQDSTA